MDGEPFSIGRVSLLVLDECSQILQRHFFIFTEALETLTEKQVEEFVGSAMQRRYGRYHTCHLMHFPIAQCSNVNVDLGLGLNSCKFRFS